MFKRKSKTKPARNGISKTAPRGLFVHGIWQCDCDPRLPAQHFRVKKNGPNFNRWFWTCQRENSKKCGFFLWDEEAQPRMESAVLGNSTSEPAPASIQKHSENGNENGKKPELNDNPKAQAQQPPQTPRKQQVRLTGVGENGGTVNGLISPPSAQPTRDKKVSLSRPLKRKLPWQQDDVGQRDTREEEFQRQQDSFGTDSTTDTASLHAPDSHKETWDMSSGDENELARITESTPRKAVKTNAFVTPNKAHQKNMSVNASVPGGLVTPNESPDKHQPPPPPHPQHQDSGITLSDLDPTTPTPNRTSNVNFASTPNRVSPLNIPPTPSQPTQPLTQRAFALLAQHSVRLDAAVSAELRALLDGETRRSEGMAKGRDVARQVVEARDKKIVELEGRVRGLEGQCLGLREALGSLRDGGRR
ncbi:MAG: hypothetical protein M1831_004473 [Alyxoria varia]|nr:MAG: hypothetical protein M1831_004473 [Alyxoria varia]